MSRQSLFSELLVEYLDLREECQKPDEERAGSIDQRSKDFQRSCQVLAEMDELIKGAKMDGAED